MARGKNSAAASGRAAARVSEAEDQRRAAVIRANALERVVASRDSEIVALKDALAQSREEHTRVGTYTEADVAMIRSEARATHRKAVRAGFEFLGAHGVERFIPIGRMAEMSEAFDCEPSDILGDSAKSRNSKRMTTSKIRLYDEALRQGREI